MSGNSWVAEELAASQEGSSTMELVYLIYSIFPIFNFHFSQKMRDGADECVNFNFVRLIWGFPAVNMISIFRIMPFSLVKDNWRFEGTYRLHLHSLIVSHERNLHEVSSKAASYLLHLLFDFEDGGATFLRNVWCLSGLHGIISKNI
jgi:hypothetical protein